MTAQEEQARLEGQRAILARTTGYGAFSPDSQHRLAELNKHYGEIPKQDIDRSCKGASAY